MHRTILNVDIIIIISVYSIRIWLVPFHIIHILKNVWVFDLHGLNNHTGGKHIDKTLRWKEGKLQNFQPKCAVHPGKWTNMGTWNMQGLYGSPWREMNKN